MWDPRSRCGCSHLQAAYNASFRSTTQKVRSSALQRRLPVSQSSISAAVSGGIFRSKLPPVKLPEGPNLQPHLSRFVVVGIVLASVTLWAAAAASIIDARSERFEHALEQKADFARVFARHAAELLRVVDSAMQRAAPLMGRANDAELQQKMATLVRETGLSGALIIHLSLIDRDGRFVASNRMVAPTAEERVDLSDRLDVRTQLRTPSNDLFVGPTVPERLTGRESVHLSRAIRGADGTVDGLVVAAIDPGHLIHLFGHTTVGRNGEILLFGTHDGSVRAWRLGKESSLSQAPQTIPAAWRKVVDAAADGTLVGPGLSGHDDTLAAFTQIGTFPLAIAVSGSMAHEVAELGERERTTLVVAGVANLAILLGGLGLMLSMRRVQRGFVVLEKSRQKTLESIRAKDAFLAAVSHEFRTPLTTILGYAQLLSIRGDAAMAKEAATAIEANARKLSVLLERILAFAQGNDKRSSPAEIDVVALVEERVNAFQGHAIAAGLQIHTEPSAVPLPRVQTDAGALTRILDTLLSNAVKFTEQGQVEVRVRAIDRERLEITVEDTGSGISPLQALRLFQPFEQGEDVSRVHGGIGLGLAQAHRLAIGIGAALELYRSGPGGSCFRLVLPVGSATAAGEGEAAESA